jgi:hypothetical protein
MNQALIEHYESGGQRVARAILGMTHDELLAAPIPGKWSTHQVVIHLADAEASFADRIKRIIAMDDPTLLAWDENKFLENLFYGEQSTVDAVTLISILRRQIAKILKMLPPETFQRTGLHSERGPQTLEQVIGFANNHLDHHLKFVADKRDKLGKEVAAV